MKRKGVNNMSMKLSSFSASFKDYELDLNYYHGKDVVHQGCLLKLDSTYSWEKINSKIRNKIRSAKKLSVDIKRASGSEDDIKAFRAIWFDPEDVTIPNSLSEDEIMYMAYLDNELVGGLILTPSSPTVLYMHNLGANVEGKKNNIPALLLWHAVEELETSSYEYIDVGVSFRPALYTFFKNWQTDSYSIIFTPPFIRPDIRLTPFGNNDMTVYKGERAKNAEKVIEQYFGETYTILPRAIHCIKAILKHLDLRKADSVAIYKTFDNQYITRCVTDPIEYFCPFTREITDTTKAVIVIHEFGFPYKQIKKLKQECERRGIPLIEDCAWSYGGMIDAETKIGTVGDYAIYSLTKVFPMQYGGILKGLAINDEDNWNNFQMLDYFKREIIIDQLSREVLRIDEINRSRRENWAYLAKLFRQDGFEVYGDLEDQGIYPGAFLVRPGDLQAVFERYETFGVETGRYYPEDVLFMPVHQGLSKEQLDYMYGVFRGKLNLSSNYQRNTKKS